MWMALAVESGMPQENTMRVTLYRDLYGKTSSDPIDGQTILDFCHNCKGKAITQYKDDPLVNGLDESHPPYSEQYPPYTCDSCGKELTGKDD